MSNIKKLMMSAATGGATNIEDVFSTHVYTGAGASQTIDNGIDLAGAGGMTWIKARSIGYSHVLLDTERGSGQYLFPNDTSGYNPTSAFAFNNSGFNFTSNFNIANGSGKEFASWTFRKAPKFFDVVTYTGNATFGTTISHNLGSVPGMIWIKRLDSSEGWFVYHRSVYGTSGDRVLYLDQDYPLSVNSNAFGNAFPTATEFTLGAGNGNANGGDYVAYLFAHNNGDGEFGPNGDLDIIKCGSYTGNGQLDGPTVDLDFEPQFLLIKNTGAGDPWVMVDNIRGLHAENTSGSVERPLVYYLSPNNANQEYSNYYLGPLHNGFKLGDNGHAVNENGKTYIYMAIRRGPTAVPESASDVFNVQHQNDSSTGYYGHIGKPVDLWITRPKNSASNWLWRDRLRAGNYLWSNNNEAEQQQTLQWYDNMEGALETTSTNTNQISWTFRRAPGFFDMRNWVGNGTAGRQINHDLGVPPEFIIVRYRNTNKSFYCYHKGLNVNGDNAPETDYVVLNTNQTASDYDGFWNDTAPTATHFTLGNDADVNGNNQDFIAWMWASLDGVSKVGSYTGDGTNGRVIDCGFSTGARLIIIRAVNIGIDWSIWDVERGITSGNDGYLRINENSSEASVDGVGPHNSGFTLTSNAAVNYNGWKYIFLAIA